MPRARDRPSGCWRAARCTSAALLLLAVLGCSDPPMVPAVTLHRGLSGEPASLDPAAAVDSFSHEVLKDLYEGLTTESATGDVVPGVAATWTVDPGGTLYVFQLRSDARWSNGNPVRAQDFVAAWRRVVDPHQASPVADDLRLIAHASAIIAGQLPSTSLGVEARGDSTLAVTLEQPAPYFPQVLAHPAAYPLYSEASARSHDPATWVSNGAYVLAGWSPETGVTLKQNVHYWDRGKVHIGQVEYVVSSDANAQYTRFRAGALDLTDNVPNNAAPALRREHSRELLTSPFLATAYYGLNLSRPPFRANVKLRQALSMAIDRKRLAASLAFDQVPAFGLVPPGTWNYEPQSYAWTALGDEVRLAEARRLYAEAGYSAHKPLKLRLLYNINPAIKDTAIVVASMWHEALGIDTELIDEEYRVFLQSRHDRGRWEVVRLAWIADFDDASNFLDTLRAQSSNDDPGYDNPAYDALLDTAAGTADAAQRRSLLENAERTMLADYPLVPLYFFVSKRLVKPYVHGVVLNPLNHLRSQGLSLDAR